MSEQQFYVNGNWYTYEEAHNLLGLTRSRPENVTFLSSDFSTVQIRKDVDDNTFYDSENHIWHDDINEFSYPLYRSLGEITLYKCESATVYDCYTDTVKNDDPKFVNFELSFSRIIDLYSLYGITQYRCRPYIMEEGAAVVWYDDILDLYWDDRPGKKLWTDTVQIDGQRLINVAKMDGLDNPLDHMDFIYVDNRARTMQCVDNQYDLFNFIHVNNEVLSMPSIDDDMPHVSTSGNFGTNNIIRYDGGTYPIPKLSVNGTLQNSWLWVGDSSVHPTYDSSKTYAIVYGIDDRSGGNVEPITLGVVLYDDSFAIQNKSQSEISVQRFSIAVCDSDSASVTIVVSGSTAKNAFVINKRSLQYYYVLDGVNTEWVSDLSSIGYSLPTLSTGYVSADKSYQNVHYNNTCDLFDVNGNRLSCYTGHAYIPVSYVDYNYNTVTSIPSILGIKKGWNSVLEFGFIRFSSDSYLVRSVNYFDKTL